VSIGTSIPASICGLLPLPSSTHWPDRPPARLPSYRRPEAQLLSGTLQKPVVASHVPPAPQEWVGSQRYSALPPHPVTSTTATIEAARVPMGRHSTAGAGVFVYR
jgi:hypothetical protein